MSFRLRLEHGTGMTIREGAKELALLANRLDISIVVRVNCGLEMLAYPGEDDEAVWARWLRDNETHQARSGGTPP